MGLKVWNGSRWETKTPKRWNGSRWVDGTIKHWNGSRWVSDYVPPVYVPKPSTTTKTYTDTWTATWSETYKGDNTINRNYSSYNRMYQGRYGRHDTVNNIIHDPIYFGQQRSLMGFNYRDIQSKLAGATITKVELYLYMEHSWYVSEGRASIVSHRATVKPNTFQYVAPITESIFRGRGTGQWIQLGTKVGYDLMRGSVTGLGLLKGSNDPSWYAYFSGAGKANAPKLRITYTKTVTTGSSTPQIKNPTPSQPTQTINYFTYTVKRGDSLWAIGQRYGVTVAQLQSWNGISGSLIHPNDKLKIYTKAAPSNQQASTPKYVTVQRGEGPVNVIERLMRAGLVSSDFNTAANHIRRLNGWSMTGWKVLHPGDKVIYSR